MIEQLVGMFKPRRFSGEVVDVQRILEEYDPIEEIKCIPPRQIITIHHGDDKDEMLIIKSYLKERYDVTLRNQEGETRTFRILGKPPEIGSEQKYHPRLQRE